MVPFYFYESNIRIRNQPKNTQENPQSALATSTRVSALTAVAFSSSPFRRVLRLSCVNSVCVAYASERPKTQRNINTILNKES